METIEEEKIKITAEEYFWLDCHGGRNENDVKRDEDGLFVWMSDGFCGKVRVYLPGYKGNEGDKVWINERLKT